MAIKKGNNIFAFKNVATGYYLVWKGSNEGINNNAGLMEKYDSIYCCFKVASVTEVKNGKILVSKRANGTQDGTFIQNADGNVRFRTVVALHLGRRDRRRQGRNR